MSRVIWKAALVVLLAGSIAWATCSPQTECVYCGLTAYFTYSKWMNGKEYGRYTHRALDGKTHVSWVRCD